MMRLMWGLVRAMPRLGTVLAIVAAVVLLALTLMGILILPARMVDLVHPGITDLDHSLAEEAALRTTMIGFLGGLAVIGGAIVGGLNLVHSRRVLEETQRQNRETIELQRRGQVTERFNSAIEQLGQAGPDKLDVRIGAAYSLEQIAGDSPELHWPVMEVLTAYLREHTRARPAGRLLIESVPDDPIDRTPADLQAIATVIARRHLSQDPTDQHLDLREIDLRLVRWRRAQLKGAILYRARLERANLYEIKLDGADLDEAQLDGAILIEARLVRAGLYRARLERANLLAARLEGANLGEAHLQGANLHRARLEGASLYEADLEGATLSQAELGGANLIRANLKAARLERADLCVARLDGADLSGANLDGADLSGASLDGANLRDVDLNTVRQLTWAQVQGAVNVDVEWLSPHVRHLGSAQPLTGHEGGPSGSGEQP